jgi:hypothetical protein
MLKIMKSDVNASCSLEEYVEYINSNIDLNDLESIESSKDKMKELYNNREVLTDLLNRELKNLYDFQSENSYTPPSLILAKGKKFFVRANVWNFVEQVKKKDLNVYGLPHDHNFNFMTLNYHGPGYYTKMFDYDYDNVIGEVGEKVDLNDLGTMNIKEGEMFLYVKNKHVHSQIPPKKSSVTINLMIHGKDDLSRNQYVFDLESKTIVEKRGHLELAKNLIKLGKDLGDANTLDIISSVERNIFR